MTKTKGSAAAPKSAPQSAVGVSVLRVARRFQHVGRLAQLAGEAGDWRDGAEYIAFALADLRQELRTIRSAVRRRDA